ncbi:DUF881 domain-containing protein [Clostridium bowmanii]|uniref:DUF881 domain-containing protein n=1 Tax=Clostridium bowmanii TaxID=132925 RepID=UPI001C0D30C0|nr:DUF881 domain-containing protein [Clostridium bowmanii]MBU3190543.1 DUF881 domain-containing protein [Clostridium bowmanii]MCA1075074.1 DUF881 domain-containing protein [Clostridium bowmanii]
MKNNEATIFVFIASIIVGLLIAMNIGFEGKSNFLDVKQYNEAYNERSKLYSDVNNLKEQYYNASSKLQKYDSGDVKKFKVLEEIQKEVSDNNIIIGKSDVQGSGVKITLDDGNTNIDEFSSRQLIHDADIAEVINDLRNAGAEAIAVNGERIIYNNYALCFGAPIKLNGVKIIPPFNISAIGNEDVLYNYLTLEATHIKELKVRQVKISIVKADDVQILAYTGDFKYKYMNSANEKK